jgi:hypothetical protein
VNGASEPTTAQQTLTDWLLSVRMTVQLGVFLIWFYLWSKTHRG